MTGKLEGRIAVVTGSDSGIGQASAELFAREGAAVVVNYLHDEAGARETRDRIGAAGGRAIVVQADVRREEQVDRLFDAAQSELGLPTILVNNAGVNASGTKLIEMSTETWRNAIDSDLTAAFFTCRRFARDLRDAHRPGKIINVTSVHEEIPMPGGCEYDAAKGGLKMLTRTLALELAPLKINVNNLAPGMILTPMNEEAVEDPNVRERRSHHIPWNRPGRPEEVAKLALYLASDDADYATGATFFLDGGLRMMMGQGA